MVAAKLFAKPTLPAEQWQMHQVWYAASKMKGCLRSARVNCRTLQQAFSDLRGLMAKAGEMVQLAERFRQALADKAAASHSAEDAMDAEMEAELISMGIASPVTKATAGALYYKELSRQVYPCLSSA